MRHTPQLRFPRRFSLILIAALIAAIGPAGTHHTAAQTGGEFRLTVDGVERSYALTVPAALADADQPVPLVIALHPFASSGQAMRALTGLDAAAEARGFIAAYPNSLDLRWNDGEQDAGVSLLLPTPDDVGFIGALIDTLAADYPIDPARVYLTGFGTGGDMAYRLACAIPDRLAGVAVVSALTWEFHTQQCGPTPDPVQPVPMLILHGRDHVENPVEGRSVTDDETGVTLRILGAEDTAAFWAGRDGCDLDAVGGSVDEGAIRYDTCAGNSHVALYLPDGVQNNWPRVGDYVLNQFGIDATDLVTRFFMDGTLPDALVTRPVEELYDQTARSYLVYVPPTYDPTEPEPVVLMLHGRPGNAAGQAYVSDLNRVADEHGFIVVYPDGSPVGAGEVGREWNYTLGTPGYRTNGIDDTAFFSVLIDDLARDLAIDQSRLYVTGFSNGGFMTQRAACDGAGRFAAFASISASLFPRFQDLCADTPPVPILLMHGTADISVPWNGSEYGGVQIALSVPDTVAFWAVHDQCDPQQIDYTLIPSSEPNPVTQVYRYAIGGCADNSEVLYYVIENGGHNIPGVPGRLDPSFAGSVNTDITAGEVIWEFFAAHNLP